MKNIFFFLLIGAISTLGSCKKGDTGPYGPPGLDGRDGTNGLDGVDGQNGANGQDGQDAADGNYNIRVYKTTINASEWYVLSPSVAVKSFQAPILTNFDLQTGLVMVYVTEFAGSGSAYTALPVRYKKQLLTYDIGFGNGIEIQSYSDSNNPFTGTINVKVIAIPADGLVRYPADLDWSNYDAVKAALNLSE